MNPKTIAIPLLVTSFFAMLTDLSHADPEGEKEILASVTRVQHPKNGVADTVSIQMTIHTPSRLGGLQFMVVTESNERAKIRAEFPAGSLQKFNLPANILKELEAQIDAYAAVEKSLDTGTDPMMISQGFLLPSISLLELSTQPVQELELKPIALGLLKEFRTSPDSDKFTELKKGKLKTEVEAKDAVSGWLLEQGKLSADQTCFVFGLYQASMSTGRRWLWEVRVNVLPNKLSAIILVDAVSSEIIGALPTNLKANKVVDNSSE